jgi:hypothetical protein
VDSSADAVKVVRLRIPESLRTCTLLDNVYAYSSSLSVVSSEVEMDTTLWTLADILVCGLLVFSTYAAFIGLAGVLGGASYVWCARCHHHYLRNRGSFGHRCPHGIAENAYQLAWWTTHRG